MRRNTVIYIVMVLLLLGCSSKITSKEISPKEAEEIVIKQAIEEGYSNPRLFTDYGTTTSERSIYSIKHQKDVRAWQVALITDERPREEALLGDLYYFVHIETGEIVHKVSSVF